MTTPISSVIHSKWLNKRKLTGGLHLVPFIYPTNLTHYHNKTTIKSEKNAAHAAQVSSLYPIRSGTRQHRRLSAAPKEMQIQSTTEDCF